MSPRGGKSRARPGPSKAVSKSSGILNKKLGAASKAKTKASHRRSAVRPRTPKTSSDEDSTESECESNTTEDAGWGETGDSPRRTAKMMRKTSTEVKRTHQPGKDSVFAVGSHMKSATPSRYSMETSSTTSSKYYRRRFRSQSNFSSVGSSDSTCSLSDSDDEHPGSPRVQLSSTTMHNDAAPRHSVDSNSGSTYYKAKMSRLSLTTSPESSHDRSGGSHESTGSEYVSHGSTSSTASEIAGMLSASTIYIPSRCSEGDARGRKRYRSPMVIPSSSSERNDRPDRKRRYKNASTSSDEGPVEKRQRRPRGRPRNTFDNERRRGFRRHRHSTVSSVSDSDGSDEPLTKRTRPPRRRSSSYEKVLAWLEGVNPGM